MIEDGKIVSLIERTNELLAVLVKLRLSSVIESELSDSKKRRLYEMTGGPDPVKVIATKVGMSAAAISRQWQRWEQLGLLIKDAKSYRRVLS